MRQMYKVSMIAAIAAVSGLAASAQDCEKSKCTTSSSSCVQVNQDGEAFEVRLENGTVVLVKANGLELDESSFRFDEEDGFVVIDCEDGDGESVVIDISGALNNQFVINSTGSFGSNVFAFAPTPLTPQPPLTPLAFTSAPSVTDFWSGGAESFEFAPQPDGHPRVMIGITHDQVGEQLRGFLNLDEGAGIYVLGVQDGLPAEKAGIESGDIIIEVDGQYLGSSDVLLEILGESDPGDKIEVIVIREGDKKKLKLKLVEFDNDRLGGQLHQNFRFAPGADIDLHVTGDGEHYVFGNGAEGMMELFDDIDFEFPDGMENLPDELRDEIMEAMEMAKQRGNEAQIRTFVTRRGDVGDRGDRVDVRALRDVQQAVRGHVRSGRDHERAIEDNLRHGEHQLHEIQSQLHESENQIRIMIENGMMHEQFNEENLELLRQHGLNLEFTAEGDQERLVELGLRLSELGGHERLIRSGNGGRAFIIESEPEPESGHSPLHEIETQRDDLLHRNHELEQRVQRLERQIERLMRSIEDR